MTNIQCPKCHASVTAESRFCPKCGQTLSQEPRCPACDAPNPAGAYFCARCGAALATAQSGFTGGANTGGYGGTGSSGGYGGGANTGGYGQPGFTGGANTGGYGGTGSGGGYGGGSNSGGYGGTGSSGGYGGSMAEDLEGSLTERLEKRMKGIQERIDQRLGQSAGEGEATTQAYAGAPSPAAPPVRHAESPAGKPEPPLIYDDEINALLKPDPGESRQAMALIRNSRMIENNALYTQRAKKITFCFLSGDPTVNAASTDYPIQMEDGTLIQPPGLVLYAGLARAFHLAATATAVYLCNRNEAILRQIFCGLGQGIIVNNGTLPAEAYGDMIQTLLIPAIQEPLTRSDERFLARAQSLRLSLYLEVLAHEVGHIILGHTLGRPCNYDMARNQEREADSVASSILSSCPYREYHFLGQVLGNIIFVWMEQIPDQPKRATTHPLSRERFDNAFVSNSDAALEAERAFGLSRARLEALLP